MGCRHSRLRDTGVALEASTPDPTSTTGGDGLIELVDCSDDARIPPAVLGAPGAAVAKPLAPTPALLRELSSRGGEGMDHTQRWVRSMALNTPMADPHLTRHEHSANTLSEPVTRAVLASLQIAARMKWPDASAYSLNHTSPPLAPPVAHETPEDHSPPLITLV